jgi:hypothetical protein
MKLTTTQLRRIIKEEVTKAVTVKEAAGSGGSIKEQLLDGLMQLQATFGKLDLSEMAVKLDEQRAAAGADKGFPGAYSYASEEASAQDLIEKIHEHILHAMDEIDAGE